MRLSSIFIAILAATLACGKSNSDGPSDQAKTPAKGSTADTGAKQGGHLRLNSNEPRYLNPVIETRDNRAIPLIFEGLVGLDNSLAPAPLLAQSWDISKDGKTITFRLRKDVTWHDGKPFTSKDVAFTVDAVRNTQLPSIWKAYLAPVIAVETPDDHTVIARYENAYAPALVTWTMGILPAHVFEGKAIEEVPANREPVGTGPYRLSRWEPGQRIILAANETWWRDRANIDTIELVFATTDSIDALDKGTLHFAELEDTDEWLARTADPVFRDRFESTKVTGSKFRTIAWNTTKKPFDDKRVRLALTLGLNRDRVIDSVFRGEALALSAPFFPNMFGLDSTIAPHPFDLDRAVKLLDEAGYPSKEGSRFDVELIVIESLRGPTSDEMLAIFRRDLGAIGIDLKVRFVSAKAFFAQVVNRKFDAAYFGWLPDIPDPDPFALLHSSQIDGGQNFSGLANPEIDRLLDEARRTLIRDERRALYNKLHAVLHLELPYTPLYAPFVHFAWRRSLRGVNPRDIGPQPRVPGIATWWIEE